MIFFFYLVVVLVLLELHKYTFKNEISIYVAPKKKKSLCNYVLLKEVISETKKGSYLFVGDE